MNTLNLIGRDKELFNEDIKKHEQKLSDIVSPNHFLVLGRGGYRNYKLLS
ncbi:MAG: hypothetical protein R6U11_11660 [Bacteroidales bacterium]